MNPEKGVKKNMNSTELKKFQDIWKNLELIYLEDGGNHYCTRGVRRWADLHKMSYQKILRFSKILNEIDAAEKSQQEKLRRLYPHQK